MVLGKFGHFCNPPINFSLGPRAPQFDGPVKTGAHLGPPSTQFDGPVKTGSYLGPPPSKPVKLET